MASSPLTSRTSSSLSTASLQLSHTCFRDTTMPSSLRPLGVVSRGKTMFPAADRAPSQSGASDNASKAAAVTRNFSP